MNVSRPQTLAPTGAATFPAPSGACVLRGRCFSGMDAPAQAWRGVQSSAMVPESGRGSALSWCPLWEDQSCPGLRERLASPGRAVRRATPAEMAHALVGFCTSVSLFLMAADEGSASLFTFFPGQTWTSVSSGGPASTSAGTQWAASTVCVLRVTNSCRTAETAKVQRLIWEKLQKQPEHCSSYLLFLRSNCRHWRVRRAGRPVWTQSDVL